MDVWRYLYPESEITVVTREGINSTVAPVFYAFLLHTVGFFQTAIAMDRFEDTDFAIALRIVCTPGQGIRSTLPPPTCETTDFAAPQSIIKFQLRCEEVDKNSMTVIQGDAYKNVLAMFTERLPSSSCP